MVCGLTSIHSQIEDNSLILCTVGMDTLLITLYIMYVVIMRLSMGYALG